MNYWIQKLLPRMRRILSSGVKTKEKIRAEIMYDMQNQQAAEEISRLIKSGSPLLISRIGTGELEAVVTYIFKNKTRLYPGQKIGQYLKNEIPIFWWHEGIRKSLANGAGMFSTDNKGLDNFAIEMLRSYEKIDLLGSWNDDESYLDNYLATGCIKVPLRDLEPYRNCPPWTRSLKGKNVLVIHPFAETIESQYKIKDKLFKAGSTLPDFNLITYIPVQTIANNLDFRFSSWKQALNFMYGEISKINFDIAVIGAGSYGMPLGAFIKKSGKQAIHLGGATQILFGIKGKRWESIDFFKNMFNEYWVRPNANEKPINANHVEGGCYW